jgi:hypothetical protein
LGLHVGAIGDVAAVAAVRPPFALLDVIHLGGADVGSDTARDRDRKSRVGGPCP